MEYERAFLLKKCIIGFRTKRSLKEDDLGKMVEGAWSDIQHKASTLQELRKILFEI